MYEISFVISSKFLDTQDNDEQVGTPLRQNLIYNVNMDSPSPVPQLQAIPPNLYSWEVLTKFSKHEE